MGPPPPAEITEYRQMWEKAIEEYFKAASEERDEEFRRRFEAKLRKCAECRESDESSGTGALLWGAAPGVINAAGQVAALSFPPATVITSVISLLVDAGKEYHDLFDNVGQMREQCESFFERLDRHEQFEIHSDGKYAPHLKKIELQLLCSHIRICGFVMRYAKDPPRYKDVAEKAGMDVPDKSNESIKDQINGKGQSLYKRFTSPGKRQQLASSFHRFTDKAKLFFKILAGSNEINGELDIIDKLETRLTAGTVDDTHMISMKLQKMGQDQMDADSHEKSLQTIKNSLNIQDDHKSWAVLHSKLRPVAGMGDWIIENDLFKNWSDFGVPCESPILRLEGPEKYGKTFLCHRVISHLQDIKCTSIGEGAIAGTPISPGKEPKASNMTASVAYFYFGKGGSDAKDKATLRDAIAAIMWQLVQDDNLYRQFVAKKCGSSASPMKKEELWKLLQPRRPTSRFFVVLDGVDHAAECEDDLKNLISQIASGIDKKDRLRIMLSGTLQSLACIENQGSAIDLSDTEETRQDVKIFIKHVLNSQMQPIAGDPEEAIDRPNLPEDPTETLLGILTEVRNYDFIDFLLGKMSKGFFPDARLKELADELTAGGEFALVKFQTQHLNQVLQPSDIENFNQILPWLVLPNNYWPEVKQIEDVLAIHHDGQRPLLKIEAYISQTFGDLVEVDKQVLCSNSINGYYRDMFKITLESSVPDSAKQMNRALENEALHRSEIDMVRRFLKTVCDEPLYNKFGFDKFFKDKKDPPPGLIEFNPIDAHIKMITTCLKAACSRKRHEYESIHEYTTRWLPWHLSEIHPDMLSTSQVREMADVMPLLCRFFSERDVVEAWFKPEWTEESLEGWFSAEKQPDCAMRWINDLSFAKVPEVQELRKSVHNLRDDTELLKQATCTAAFDWLALDKSHPRWSYSFLDSCQWIVSYLNELQQSGTGRLDKEWTPSVESILDAERWAQKALNTVQNTARWDVRIAVVLTQWHPQEALKRWHGLASNAIDKEILPQIFAGCVFIIEKFPDCHVEALEILQPLFDDFKLRSHEYETLIQSYVMQWMGIVYSAAGKGPEAVECLKRSLECVPSDGEREGKLENIHLLLDSLLTTGQHEEVVNTLLALSSDDLIELVGKFQRSKFRGKIAMAVTKSGIPNSKTIFQRALDEYEKKNQSQAVTIAGDAARICQALILSWTRVQSDLDAAIQLWQAVLHHPKKDRSNTRLSYYEKQAETQLSRAFYLKARKSGQQDILDEDRTTYFRSSFGTEGVSDNAPLATRALHVARFHNLHGRKDAAKQEMKRKLLYVKDILSDDDDLNDLKGYRILADILICLGRNDDARMAFMLHFGYSSESDPASSASNRGYWGWWCGGYCGTTWERRLSEDLYYCKDCLSLPFDKRCMDRVLEGSLGFNVCEKDHEFLRVPKWGEESARELKERVPDVKQWKDSVLKSLLGEEEATEPEAAGDVKDGAVDNINDRRDALQQ